MYRLRRLSKSSDIQADGKPVAEHVLWATSPQSVKKKKQNRYDKTKKNTNVYRINSAEEKRNEKEKSWMIKAKLVNTVLCNHLNRGWQLILT